MNDTEYTVTTLDQLDDYQQFINEYGLCQVINIYHSYDCVCFSDGENARCGYEYEVVEAVCEHKEKEGSIYILEINDKINLS